MTTDEEVKNGGSNVVEMRRRIDEAKRLEDDILGMVLGHALEPISPKLIAECLRDNERGDGRLFAELYRDKFIHVKNTGNWLAWAGHHWQLDKSDDSTNAVDGVAKLYLEQAAGLDEKIASAKAAGNKDEATRLESARKAYKDRGQRLRSLRGAKNCLEFAHKIGEHSLMVIGDELDQRPWLLACENGVLDLQTGKLNPGRPEDYLVKAIPVEWQGINAPCPTWERFIAEIHQEDPEVIDFIQRLLGYALTGRTTEHFIACFIGEGRNGKGTMFELLKWLMGDLAWAVQPELILDQKIARSSSGPSADMMSLHGRRLVIASETDEHRKVSGAKVKILTGADTLCARSPHDRFETNFEPTHKLFLYTNHIPSGLTKDYALYKRLLLIRYPLKFVDDPKESDERKRDPALPAALRKEAPGILAWLVRGCMKWQAAGSLKPPASIMADVDALRLEEDNIQQFFNDTCSADTASSEPFKEIYASFAEWFTEKIDDSDKYRPSKKAVSEWFDKKGFERGKPGGTATIYGVSLRRACL